MLPSGFWYSAGLHWLTTTTEISVYLEPSFLTDGMGLDLVVSMEADCRGLNPPGSGVSRITLKQGCM